jgi:O-antigen/teichoic acid export membrane protein
LSNPINLTSGRLLARNTIINLVGGVIPFLAALFAVPVLIHSIGVDRYGVFTLSMMAVGYFGLFDLGLGRAATKLIAEAAGSGGEANIPGLFWTSLYLMLALGAVAAVLVTALAPWLVLHVLRIPPALRPESLHAFYLLALSMPFVISSASLGGSLSAFQRFDLINAVRVPAGIFSYLGPLLMLPFSHRLGWLVAILVVGRLAGWLATFILCMRVFPALRRELRPRGATLRPMLSFGGWVTVSNIVGPVIVYFDRFLIGAMLSMAAVAYYAVPYQVATRLWIIPISVGGVMFPAFSSIFRRNPARAALLFGITTKYVLLSLFPPVLLIVTFAPAGLRLWLGESFARNSADVLRWLTFAMFVNSLAWTPYALIQAADRPDLIAKLHLVELPLYVPLLWWMIAEYGVVGVALMWTVRVIATTVVVFGLAWHLLPQVAPAVLRVAMLISAASVLLACGTILIDPLEKGLYVVAALLLFAVAAWLLLEPAEKDSARSFLRSIRWLPTEAAQ